MSNPIRNSQIVGIDLGTTYSVIAYYDDLGRARVIPNAEGEMKTPSVVYVGPGMKEILVGTPAWNMQMLEPKRTIKEFKRDIGTDIIYFEEGGHKITPDWCANQVLRKLRTDTIAFLGDPHAASSGVITVPAYFRENERQCVKSATEQAGITVLQLINEPTAAALAYGLSQKQGDQLVLVADLGGGTFDATLIQFAGGEANVLSTDGDKHLGGKDVDDLLLGLVREAFRDEHRLDLSREAHPAEWFTIEEEVRRQKHLLSARTEVLICARAEGRQVKVIVTRDTLRSLMASLLKRIREICIQVVNTAKVDMAEIQASLLVGGSSRLVCFREELKHLVGKDCLLSNQVSPDLAVAEGATVHAVKVINSKGNTVVGERLQAIPAPSIKHRDVMSHSLGVSVQDVVSGAKSCSVILPKNTPIPCQASKPYASVSDDQTCFKVMVLQGEDGQTLQDCLVVGEREIDLPSRKSDKPSLEATMGYDESGLVTVTVRDLISGKVENITTHFGAHP